MFDIENSLGFLLAKCHQKACHLFKGKLEKYNLTPPQFAALSFLWKTDGINQIQLGELMDADRTTISGITERLEKIGLIERRVNQGDRRSFVLIVTEKGFSLREELETVATEFNALLSQPFSDEELADLINKLKNIRFSKI